MLNSVLFLWTNDKEFHALNAKRRGVEVAAIYKNVSLFLRVVRRVQIILGVFSIRPWLGNWSKNINKYKVVILHASSITPIVAKFIKKVNPNIRLIIWYWNPVEKCVPVSDFLKYDCEIWSFDEKNSIDYKIGYNTQYYFKDVKLSENIISNDVFFLGGDKGRLKKLLIIKEEFSKRGIESDFHITKTEFKAPHNDIYRDRISYNQYLDKISESKAILDIVAEGQTGLTLRPLEALFLKKKLITNDNSIVKRDFYNKQNIFILGLDDLDNLYDFINSPLIDSDEDIYLKYDFDSWIYRFIK